MIFNLFKSKPTLKELIPDGFVDIHSHILPGIDDGAKDVNESVELIKKMKEIGFLKIMGTPHTYPGLYENSNKSIKESFNLIADKIPKDVKIGYASEYMLDNSIIQKLIDKEVLCINNNFILVEMSYMAPPINLYEIIYEIKVNGYIPVLAHPERYLFLHQNFKEYYKLKKFGCLFQANLLSFTNYYGLDVLKISEKLLKKELIDFVGSDIHSQKHITAFQKTIKIKNSNLLEMKIENNNKFR